MKERPILFSAPMVRSILARTKWQTRRIVKPQPDVVAGLGSIVGEFTPDDIRLGRIAKQIRCPYGVPGDRLWVREKWAPHFAWEGVQPAKILIDARSCLFYAADGGITGGCAQSQRASKWIPSIHMPRAASRITLEITDVRVERLQDISEEDAIAEGIEPVEDRWKDYSATPRPDGFADPRKSYRTLWQSINGPGSWDANPWVWVVCFRRLP